MYTIGAVRILGLDSLSQPLFLQNGEIAMTSAL
jgi:hypothetical protein